MIAIGGSLGSSEALHKVLAQLPANFPDPILVVLHRHRESDATLLRMISKGVILPVTEAEDKEPLAPGKVYLCPPDYHLLVDRGCVALSTDPLVNHARPALDVLFESVAEWYGPRAVAVVLTGSGSDGAAGARRVAAAGGTVIVQEPATAEAPWMPAAALAAAPSAHVRPLLRIAEELVRLRSLTQ